MARNEKRVVFYLDPETAGQLEASAASMDRSVSWVVRRLIQGWLGGRLRLVEDQQPRPSF